MALIGRVIRWASLAISLSLLLSPTAAQSQDTPNGKLNQGASPELLSKLDRPITLEKGIERSQPLMDVLEFLADRYQVQIRIDEPAWKKVLKDCPVGDLPTSLPRLRNVRLETVLHCLVIQVNGDFEIRHDIIEVVPSLKRKKKTERPSDQQKRMEEQLRARLRKQVDFEKANSNVPFKDLIADIADRYDLNIVIDSLAFRNERKIEFVGGHPVTLPKMSGVSIENILRTLVKQVGGSYEIRDNLILIVPPRTDEQS